MSDAPSAHHILTQIIRRATALRRGAFAFAIAIALPPIARAESGDLLTVEQLKRLTLEQILNVEVTSVARRPERLLDTASAIQLITGEEIVRSGATSIPEALRLAPNLQVAQKNPHDWGISARGFNTALANKLLVMIDGRTVYTPLFSGVFWDAQDYLLADLSRIEVVSGPGATLWGANAVNGVINITSKSAKETQGGYVEFGGGTELRDFAAVRYGTVVAPNVYLRVYGKTSDRDTAVLSNGTAAPDAMTMHRGGFRLDADVRDGTTATLQGDLYKGSEYVVTSGIQRVGGGNLLGRWTRTYAPDSEIRLQLYYDRTHLVDPITNQFGTNQPLTDDLDTYDLDFQHRLPLGDRQKAIWGIGYRLSHDAVQNASNTAFLPASVTHQLFSAFGQDEIAVGRAFNLTFGSKFEHNDYTGMEVEPSVRAHWAVASNQSVWAAVSRAVRMPSRYDRDIFQPRPLPLVASGSKQFVSETLLAYEIGYRAQIGTKVTGSVSAYYNRYNDLRSFGPAPGNPRQFMFGNNLHGENHGVEASVRYSAFDGWRLRAGYTYLIDHIQAKPGTVDLFGGRNEVSDPKHQIFIGSSWDLPRNFSFDADVRWIDTLQTVNGTVPSYAELGARFAWQPNDRLEFSIVGQNLLHDHHPEFGIAIPRREEIERGVYAKVAVRF